jgi:hypothetical protein
MGGVMAKLFALFYAKEMEVVLVGLENRCEHSPARCGGRRVDAEVVGVVRRRCLPRGSRAVPAL